LQRGALLFLTNYQEEDIRVREMMVSLYSDCRLVAEGGPVVPDQLPGGGNQGGGDDG
jgi:hypothetical protein